MNDNDLLDLIADRAPAPASDYADRVLVAGRRARRRRRVLAVAAAAVCAVVAVVTPLLVANVPDERHTTAAQSSAAPDSVPIAELYVTATAAILSEAMPAAEIASFDVLDHFCQNVLEPEEPCVASPMPPDVRQGLAGMRPKQVTFVPDDSGLRGPAILVTLGPIRWVRDDLAEVPVSFRQAGQPTVARAYRIQLRDGSWIRTG